MKEGENCSGIMKGRVRLCRSMTTHSSVILAVFLHSAYLFIRVGSALRFTLHLLPPSFLDITYPVPTCKHYRVDISATFSIVRFVRLDSQEGADFSDKALPVRQPSAESSKLQSFCVVTCSCFEMCATICWLAHVIAITSACFSKNIANANV